MRSRSKTSIEILNERDALHVRVLELELALQRVSEDVELALVHPEIQFLTLCRVGTVVRGALHDSAGAVVNEIPGPPISKVRATATPMSIRDCG